MNAPVFAVLFKFSAFDGNSRAWSGVASVSQSVSQVEVFLRVLDISLTVPALRHLWISFRHTSDSPQAPQESRFHHETHHHRPG